MKVASKVINAATQSDEGGKWSPRSEDLDKERLLVGF